jgi:hypothetical protein
MARYIARAIIVAPDPWTNQMQHLSGEVVNCEDPVNTGLVDQGGVPIWRYPDQIGFDITPKR